jgi:hypothetical protein
LYKIYKSAGYQTVDIVQMICYTWRNSGSGSVAVAGGANNDGSSNFLEEHSMRNGSHAHSSVETLAQKLPEARALLREARIDSTSRLRLADAALATSTNVDELLAVLEDRLRRQARRATPAPAVHVEEELVV